MEQVKACKMCGSPLNSEQATGRPRIYCGTICRRAAEMRIRRLNGLLTRVERRRQDMRLADVMTWNKSTQAKELKRLDDEIARLEGELRELLAGLGGDE